VRRWIDADAVFLLAAFAIDRLSLSPMLMLMPMSLTIALLLT
jgi:hypothetical protein